VQYIYKLIYGHWWDCIQSRSQEFEKGAQLFHLPSMLGVPSLYYNIVELRVTTQRRSIHIRFKIFRLEKHQQINVYAWAPPGHDGELPQTPSRKQPETGNGRKGTGIMEWGQG